MELFKLLESCCTDVVEWPPWSAVAPGRGVDGDKYAQLLDAVNLLRDVRLYRPLPAGWQSLRPVLIKRFEKDGTCFVSAERKYMHALARKSVGGRPHLGRSGAARPSSAKGHRNASAVTKQSDTVPHQHMTASGDADDTVDSRESEPTVTPDNTEHIVDAGKDDDDGMMKDDSAAVEDDAASDVTIVTTDVDIAELQQFVDEDVQEMKADIANRSPSLDVKHLTLNNSVDKSNSSFPSPSNIMESVDDSVAEVKLGQSETADHISFSSIVSVADVIQQSLQRHVQVDEENGVNVELEHGSEMSKVTESQSNGSQTAENEPEAARVIDEHNLQSGKDYPGSEVDVNNHITNSSPTSVNQNIDADHHFDDETQSLSCKMDTVTPFDEAADASCSDTVLTASADSVSMQSLSTSHSNEASPLVNMSQLQQISTVNSANESTKKLSMETDREFQACVNDGKDYVQSETVVNEYTTILSPMSVDVVETSKEDVTTSDKSADAGYSDAVLTIAADSTSVRSLSHCPDVIAHLDDKAVVSMNASQPQQTSSIDSMNESQHKVPEKTGQKFLSRVSDETQILIGEVSETDAADMPITDNFGDSTSAECLSCVPERETSNSISSVSKSTSEAAITSHMEQADSLEGEKVKTLDAISKSVVSLPSTVKLSGDNVDLMMSRCFVSLYRIPSSSAGDDAAGPNASTHSASTHSQLHKCSVVLQRLNPTSLELSSRSLTKSSAPAQPCADEEDRVSVITISSDEDEAPVDVIEMSGRDNECSNVPEQLSAGSYMTSEESIHETVPEYTSVSETEAGNRNVAETNFDESSEFAASSDVHSIGSCMTSQEYVPETRAEEIFVSETEAGHGNVAETQFGDIIDFAVRSDVQDIQSSMSVSVNKPQSDKLHEKRDGTDIALDAHEMSDLVTWNQLNYYEDLAADVMKDINVSPAKEEDDLNITPMLDSNDLAAANTYSSVVITEDQNTEATESEYTMLACHGDTEASEVLMMGSVSAGLASNAESSTVFNAAKHKLVIEDENAMCSDVIESSVVVASDRSSQLHAKEEVTVAANVDEEAKTLCGDVIDRAIAEAEDRNVSSLSAVTVDSSTMLDLEENSAIIGNEDSMTLCSDVTKIITVDSSDRLSVPASELMTTTSDYSIQWCAKDVTVAANMNVEAKTSTEAGDGNMLSFSAVTVKSPTMLDHEENTTAIENEDSLAVYSDVAIVDTTDRLSILASESMATTSDCSSQLHAKEDVAVAASLDEEAKTWHGSVIDTAVSEVRDGNVSSLSAVTVDSPTVLGPEENTTMTENEDFVTVCSDVTEVITVDTADRLSVLASELMTTTSDCSTQLHAKEVAAVASVYENAKTLFGDVIDTAVVEAQDGNMSLLSAVTVNSPTVLGHEKTSTDIETEDSVTLCSDVTRLSVPPSESMTTTDSVSVVTAENSSVIENEDSNILFTDISKMDAVQTTSDTLSVLAPEPATTVSSVSVVSERVESTGLIDEVVSSGATYISIHVSQAQTSRTEHLGSNPTAYNWVLCDENSDGDVVVCDPFPIFAECRTDSDSIDNLVLSTNVSNNSEGFESCGLTDRHSGTYGDEIGEDVCVLIKQTDVPEPADEIYLCTTLISTQSSSEEQSEVDYEDDLNRDTKSVTAGQSADTAAAALQNTGDAASDFNADFQDDMLSKSSNQPVCLHSESTVDSSTYLDSEKFTIDNSTAYNCSDDAEGHSTASLMDTETDTVRSELSSLPVAYSSQDTETCRALNGTQKPLTQEQPVNSQGDSLQLTKCEANFGAMKLGGSAHDDLDSCSENFASSERHLPPVCFENAAKSTDETRSDIAEENKKVFFKLDKLSAICRDVHKNVQHSGSESASNEVPSSVPDKQEDESNNQRPVPLPASSSSTSHIFFCPDCPLKFFSYTAFISHLRTENQGFVSSAVGTAIRPSTLQSSALMPAESSPKSLDKDTASAAVVRSHKRRLSKRQNSDSSTGTVDRVQTSAPLLTENQSFVNSAAGTSIKPGTLESTALMPAESLPKSLDKDTASAAVVRSHKRRLSKRQNSDSNAGTVDRVQTSAPLLTENQSFVNSAAGTSIKPGTLESSALMPAESCDSLPISLDKDTASAAVVRSHKRRLSERQNSDSSTGNVDRVQMTAAVLAAVMTQGSVSRTESRGAQLDSVELPHPVPAKSRRSLPTSSASARRSQSKRGSVSSATGLPTRPDTSAALVPVKSRRSLPESLRKTTASASTGKSRKRKSSDSSIGGVVTPQVRAPQLAAILTGGSVSHSSELHSAEHSVVSCAKSRGSLPKSRRERNASASSSKSCSRKKSDSGAGSRTGKQQSQRDDVTSLQPAAAQSRRRLQKASSSTGKSPKPMPSPLDTSDTSVRIHRGKRDLEKLSNRVPTKSGGSLPKSDNAAASASKSESRKRSASQSTDRNTGSKRSFN